MIGVFGSLDAPLPGAVVGVWVAGVAALGALAVVVGRWRDRVMMVVVLAGCVLLPVAAETVSGPKTGLAWQGRYTLTVAVGAPILAGWIIDRSGRVPRRVAVAIGVAGAVGVAVIQVVAQVRAMNRYVVGLPSGWFDALHRGTWAGPSSPAVLLALVAAAGLAYGAWLGFLAVATPRSAVDTGPVGSAGSELVVDHHAQGGEERPGQVDDLIRAEARPAEAVGPTEALEP
jgi:hypothetical protein